MYTVPPLLSNSLMNTEITVVQCLPIDLREQVCGQKLMFKLYRFYTFPAFITRCRGFCVSHRTEGWLIYTFDIHEHYEFLLDISQNQPTSDEQATVFSTPDYFDDEIDNKTISLQFREKISKIYQLLLYSNFRYAGLTYMPTHTRIVMFSAPFKTFDTNS
jgi:hypothetical protein